MSIVLIIICLVVGTLIGAVGIGGVLLAPSLSTFAGISIHEAIPACMLSYLATGAVGAVVFARHGSIQWHSVFWVCTGAVPAAYLGATSLLSISATVVEFLIAALMIVAGIDVCNRSKIRCPPDRVISRSALVFAGFITGFGSAITGTGGPLILVPLTLFLGLPVLAAVGLSQAVQIPIAGFASLGNWLQGNLNAILGLEIAAAMIIGSLVGATFVHKIPAEPIKKVVAVLLIIVGIAFAAKVTSKMLTI